MGSDFWQLNQACSQNLAFVSYELGEVVATAAAFSAHFDDK